MAEMIENNILIRDIETKNIMTKSTLPVGGYSVNPYVGCTHGCKYCYASFMKRFTGHTEPWGTFLDVKHWPVIKNPQKYKALDDLLHTFCIFHMIKTFLIKSEINVIILQKNTFDQKKNTIYKKTYFKKRKIF